jgi:molybdate transport system substrate-binding protein
METRHKHRRRPWLAAIRVGVALLILLPLSTSSVAMQTLTVAAASDLQGALPPIAVRFEKDTGWKVSMTFGSSGTFFSQIQNGAPFDVFLSADIDYPRRLEQSGEAVKGTVYSYATGRLVLWTRNDAGVDIRQGLEALSKPAVRRVSIANPLHAPYGRAAVAALQHEHVYERVRAKLVLGENISQAAQFAQSGNADVGLIALSLAVSPAMKGSGHYVEISDALHPPIEQAAVIVARSRQQPLATQFIEALKSPASRSVLQSYGFAVPERSPR